MKNNNNNYKIEKGLNKKDIFLLMKNISNKIEDQNKNIIKNAKKKYNNKVQKGRNNNKTKCFY